MESIARHIRSKLSPDGRSETSLRLKVMHVHNSYQQVGGEDRSTQAEIDMFRMRGHEVAYFRVSNHRVSRMSAPALAAATLWNQKSYRQVRRAVRRSDAQVVHFHNTLPLVSPSAYYAAKAEGAAVVQTLHNYRPHCLNGFFLRGGRICEACAGKTLPMAGIKNRCYRGSAVASLGVSTTQALHKMLGTWDRQVDAFIAISEFARKRFVKLGLPVDRVFRKPQPIVPDLGPFTGQRDAGLFVGRLSAEKGVHTLLKAAEELKEGHRLRIVGGGPLLPIVEEAAQRIPGLEVLGSQPPERVMELMGQARFVVVPSEWFETFGRVVVEAYSRGTPVIATRIGAIEELVEEGQTGLFVQPKRPAALGSAMNWALSHPKEMAVMGQNARHRFESEYNESRNYEELHRIYEWAIQNQVGKNEAGKKRVGKNRGRS